MKTFNYESKNVRYNECFFDTKIDKKGNYLLSIYGYVEDDKQVSHISNATITVKEKLPRNQVVIDTNNNTNLISFLLELGIIKGIAKRIVVNNMSFPVVKIDENVLNEYSYKEELENVS